MEWGKEEEDYNKLSKIIPESGFRDRSRKEKRKRAMGLKNTQEIQAARPGNSLESGMSMRCGRVSVT